MCVLPMEILMMFSSWIEGVASGQIVRGTQALPFFVMVGDDTVLLYQATGCTGMFLERIDS